MVWLGPIIAGALLLLVESIVARAIGALGMGVIAYTGISTSVNWMMSNAQVALLNLPPNVISMLGLMQVDQCISMLVSAIIVRFTLQGMTSDTVKSWVKK